MEQKHLVKDVKDFPKEQVLSVMWGEDQNTFALIEIAPWLDQGKFSTQAVILMEIKTGRYYRYINERSGSYHSEYTFGWEYEGDVVTLQRVQKVPVTHYIWQDVLDPAIGGEDGSTD